MSTWKIWMFDRLVSNHCLFDLLITQVCSLILGRGRVIHNTLIFCNLQMYPMLEMLARSKQSSFLGPFKSSKENEVFWKWPKALPANVRPRYKRSSLFLPLRQWKRKRVLALIPGLEQEDSRGDRPCWDWSRTCTLPEWKRRVSILDPRDLDRWWRGQPDLG